MKDYNLFLSSSVCINECDNIHSWSLISPVVPSISPIWSTSTSQKLQTHNVIYKHNCFIYLPCILHYLFKWLLPLPANTHTIKLNLWLTAPKGATPVN